MNLGHQNRKLEQLFVITSYLMLMKKKTSFHLNLYSIYSLILKAGFALGNAVQFTDDHSAGATVPGSTTFFGTYLHEHSAQVLQDAH